jgi:hypothetical protein
MEFVTLDQTIFGIAGRIKTSLSIIGKSLNRKSLQATAIYARLDLDPVRASVNTATTAMFQAAGINQSVDAKAVRADKAG